MSARFENDLLALLSNINSSINELVEMSKRHTPATEDIAAFVHKIIYSDLQTPHYDFLDADIPDYIIQSLEQTINLDIPSYNVARDLNMHVEQTEAKLSAFSRYAEALTDYLNKANK